MQNFTIRITLVAEFDNDRIEAQINDVAFYDRPKLMDATELLIKYKKMMKRISDYGRLMLTIDAYTATDHRQDEIIYSVRYVHEYIGSDYEKLRRATIQSNAFRNWSDANKKQIEDDIKHACDFINLAQMTKDLHPNK
jgi:hypothetical protein